MEEQNKTGDANNQGDSGNAEGTEAAKKAGEGTEGAEGATSKTGGEGGGEQKKFDDPNMQAAFTQKMQEIADEKKKFEEERESFNKNREVIEENLGTLQRIVNDPEAVKFLRNRWGLKTEEEKPAFTQAELEEAQNDSAKMGELIQREINRRVDQKVTPINQNVSNLEFSRDIEDYAEAEGNEDFWDLHKAGLVKPLLRTVREEFPKARGMEIIQEAHKRARAIVNTVREKTGEDIKNKTKKEIEEKKLGVTSKGQTISIPIDDSTRGKSIIEIGKEVAKKLK